MLSRKGAGGLLSDLTDLLFRDNYFLQHLLGDTNRLFFDGITGDLRSRFAFFLGFLDLSCCLQVAKFRDSLADGFVSSLLVFECNFNELKSLFLERYFLYLGQALSRSIFLCYIGFDFGLFSNLVIFDSFTFSRERFDSLFSDFAKSFFGLNSFLGDFLELLLDNSLDLLLVDLYGLADELLSCGLLLKSFLDSLDFLGFGSFQVFFGSRGFGLGSLLRTRSFVAFNTVRRLCWAFFLDSKLKPVFFAGY